MSVDDVKHRLRGEGEEVARGTVTVDSTKALFKLRHRLNPTSAYLLDLVRAAVAAGAGTITVRIDADDVEVEHDGEPPRLAELRDLYLDALGETQVPERVYLLANGVNCAMALWPRWLVVEGGGARARLTGVSKLEVAPSERQGSTRIHVRHRLGFAARRLVGRKDELHTLRDAARFLPVKLVVNGERHDVPPLAKRELLVHAEHRKGPLHLVAGLADPTAPARLTLAVHGVIVVEKPLGEQMNGLIAWANHDGLKLDASRSDVVSDGAEMKQIQIALERMTDDLVVKALARLDDEREQVTRLALAAVAEGVKNSLRVTKGVARAPLFPGPAGEYVSLEDLRGASRDGLRVARSRYPEGSYAHPVVLIEPRPLAWELLPGGKHYDIGEDVKAAQRRDANRRRFEAQRVEDPRLARGDDVASRDIEGREAKGEVALPRIARAATVRFLHEGRLLAERVVPELEPLRLRAVIDCGRVSPTDSWDDIRPNEGYKLAIDLVRKTARRALLTRLRAGMPDDSFAGEALRAHARDLLCDLVDAELPDVLRDAPVFALAGGGWIALGALRELRKIRTLDKPWHIAPVDGKPVVIVSGREQNALHELLKRPLVDARPMLEREATLRARPRVEPVLTGVVGKVALTGDGLRGELGAPIAPLDREELRVSLVRDGWLVAERVLRARYAGTVAIVEHAQLEPNELWDDVATNDALRVALAAVEEAEQRLPAALLAASAGAHLGAMSDGVRAVIAGYLRVELGNDASRRHAKGAARQMLEAPLFKRIDGTSLSLADLAAIEGDLPTLDPSAWGVVAPPGMTIVSADAATRVAISEALGRVCVDAREAIPRFQRRLAHLGQDVRAPSLGETAGLRAAITTATMKGELAFRPDAVPGARIEVLVGGRLWGRVDLEGKLPSVGIVEVTGDSAPAPEDASLTKSRLRNLAREVHEAELALVEKAARDPDAPGARALLLEIYALGADRELASSGMTRAASVPLFPTIGGGWASLDEVAFGEQAIRYVRTAPETPVADPHPPTLIAAEPAVLKVLERRWATRILDESAALESRIAGQQRLARTAAVDTVAIEGNVLRREPVKGAGLEGEIALGDASPKLRLLIGKRPAAVHPLEAPVGVEAVVNCDGLVVTGFSDVARDDTYKRVLLAVIAAIERMATGLARDWKRLGPEERLQLAPAVASLAGWFVERGGRQHAIVSLPVLESCDEGWLSYAQLLAELQRRGSIWVAANRGVLHDPEHIVWRPRPPELELARRLSWALEDATSYLAAASLAQTRPQVTSLVAPLASPWREPIQGDGISGEVAVADRPSGKVIVELVREKRLVETETGPHPVGFAARVEAGALRVTLDGGGVIRDDTFRRVSAAIEASLERLVARLLGAGGPVAAAYAPVAAHWAGGRAGPVAQQLAQTALLRDPFGASITVGQARAEATERGSVAVVFAGSPIPDRPLPRLVLSLRDQAENALLGSLGIATELVSAEAGQAAERDRLLSLRKLATDSSEPTALARLDVDDDGWRGRLFVPAAPVQAGVLFARGGDLLDEVSGSDALGLLTNDALELEVAGLSWKVGKDGRARVGRFVNELYRRLAAEADTLEAERRPAAASAVLRWLLRHEVRGPAELARVGETSAALSRARVFLTGSQAWVDLRTIADHVLRRGSIDVAPVGADGLVLLAPPRGQGGWLAELESWLGPGALRQHATLADWQRARRDAEPDEASPLHGGLRRLRAEAEVLRAGAFKRLGARELGAIKLRRDGGLRPVLYDAEQATAFLDPENPAVARALMEADAHPERIYTLLAAVYGVVNRWLEHVTDEDEATACGALIDHLVANPGSLARRG